MSTMGPDLGVVQIENSKERGLMLVKDSNEEER